ncbi:DUF5680 domain-containing protein [Oerskovia jenensis]|uniref:DUF5680 domain-containing protein n=1 Tax=Oerskovia jenensis TaxID=162169 RepID=UPI0036D76595
MLADDAYAFLTRARARTYAAGEGRTTAILAGSVQYEFAEGPWLYRDVYYVGNGIFPGIEVVHHDGVPVWSVSYAGDFSSMSEGQADLMLQPALVEHAATTRTHESVDADYEDFRYTCRGQGDRDAFLGREEITAGGELVYWLQYAGGFIG